MREIKKVQEKNEFPPGSIDGTFSSELKTILKQTIDVWNKHREGTAGSDELAQTKDRVIPKIIELLLLPLEHEDTQRLRNRIIRHNQEFSLITHGWSQQITGLSGS
ncbi:hypothetical protein M1N47_03915 [Dehalococcoidia bacterium]|nr:hypothetical protein [Dehalococcoidia bacterium]